MGQTTLPPSILPRVSALLRMLGSSIDAEAVSAARALGRTLAAAGHDFHDLAEVVERSRPYRADTTMPQERRHDQRPAAAKASSGTILWRAPRRRAVAAKLRAGLHSRAFTSWEQKFAADIAEMIEVKHRCRFSEKQISTAEELAAKVERQDCCA